MSMSINTQSDFILARRSIRVYSPGEVSEAVVSKLLEAAMAAPSAMTKDPWRFITVRDKQTLSKLAALHPGAAMLSSAAMAIVVCGDLDAAFERQISYLLQDCSAAMENLLIAAHVLGLGACWLGVHPREKRVAALKEILRLPPSVIPVACVSIGWPAEEKEPRTRFCRDYVHHDTW